jgi:hypothetical protein
MTVTEVWLPAYDVEAEATDVLSQDLTAQTDDTETRVDNKLGLSPDALAYRDRARRDADLLQTFVDIGRLSVADRDSLIETGSRIRIIGSRLDGRWDY